eukprot:CAMPEP_0170478768 /NCGR_PEP_ID=MMETSP0208-20121228/235_1 /TAXON_ID=197538 /ORGANISM="Strombidium inclinatum, Strain S3" /LENGTH=72 /DNA_ID=CAMNT_0010751079 /DNA_START=2218 /DNA_END=2436 /DNA_ORIENTATION=-
MDVSSSKLDSSDIMSMRVENVFKSSAAELESPLKSTPGTENVFEINAEVEELKNKKQSLIKSKGLQVEIKEN